MLHTATKLKTPVINPPSLLCQGSEVWEYKETSAQKLATTKTASHAISAIYYYDNIATRRKHISFVAHSYACSWWDSMSVSALAVGSFLDAR
eukprot:scaffold57317_cov15-Tisochrysis_lutea.AAC.1